MVGPNKLNTYSIYWGQIFSIKMTASYSFNEKAALSVKKLSSEAVCTASFFL
jgi:hypothetical protein